jgi:FkbM family methyltransferase
MAKTPRLLSTVLRGHRLGKLLRLPLRLLPKKQMLPVLSGINKGYKWRVGSHIHSCWIGTYEREKQDVCAGLVHRGMTVYDIGAQAGFYSLAFSKLVGDSGHVYSFEPLAENCANLVDHLRMNGIKNVTVHQMAVSEQSGIVDFQIAESNAMGSITNEQGFYRVCAVALDTCIEKGVLPPLPDLVKMDVEGGESRVLRGAVRLLSQGRTIWLVALHGQQQKQECWEILRGHNHAIYRLDGVQVFYPSEMPDEIYALPEQER